MAVSSFTNSTQTIKSVGRTQKELSPLILEPLDWLKDAKIYNKIWEQVPGEWIKENADVVVLLYTAKGVDRKNVLKRFYHIYECTKYLHHIPIEVIFIPMDETEEDAIACFEDQANWFTLRYDDILIPTLKFMYGITCIPHLTVFKTNCEVISYNGIADIETYDKNAVISWLTVIPSTKMQRRRSEVADMYGPVWKYVKQEEKLAKFEYHKKFSGDEDPKIDVNAVQKPYVPKKYGKSAKIDSKSTEDKSETASELKNLEARRNPLAIEFKPSKLAVPNSQHFSKSAAALSRSEHSRSLHSHIGLHVHLPEDISSHSESQTKVSDNRSKSAVVAVTQPSETTAELMRARSGSANTGFSGSRSEIPDETSKLVPSEHRKQNQFHLLESLSKSAIADDALKSTAQLGISRSKSGHNTISRDHSEHSSKWGSESRAQLTESISKSTLDGTSKSAALLRTSRSKMSHGGFSEGHLKHPSQAHLSESRSKSAQ